MLNRFERYDRVERVVGKRQRDTVGFTERQIHLRSVARACMRDDVGCDVDAGNVLGASRKKRAAITLAAGNVEHLASGDERRCEKVPMPVFVPDFARGSGYEALAGPFEFVVHVWLSSTRGDRFIILRVRAVCRRTRSIGERNGSPHEIAGQTVRIQAHGVPAGFAPSALNCSAWTRWPPHVALAGASDR